MGRHTDAAAFGSRRAVLVTLVASVLLVVAGIMILRSAGDLHLRPGPDGRPGSSTPSSTTGHLPGAPVRPTSQDQRPPGDEP